MFEIGIFCFILIAMGYWATLFIMGRREDVLHGQFVETDAAPEPTPVPVSPVPTRPRVAPAAAPEATDLTPAPPASASALAPMPPADPRKLQLLLASLKQELKNAAKI